MEKRETGKRLKRLRQECDMTQREVAAIINRNQQSIAQWENGQAMPDTPTLFGLLRLYGVTSLDEFYGAALTPNADKSNEIDVSELIKAPDVTLQRRTDSLARNFLSMDDEGRDKVEKTALKEKRRYDAMNVDAHSHREILVYNMPASAGRGTYLHDDTTAQRVRLPNVPADADYGVRIQGDSMEPNLQDGDIAFIKSMPEIQNGDIGLFVLNDEGYCKRLRIDERQRKVLLESINPKYPPIEIFPEDNLRTLGKVLNGN